MKKFFVVLCLVLLVFSLSIISFAHPGGTDENGGHYDRSTGEYHYHHGYPAHQHEDGKCPYKLHENDTTTTTNPTEFPLYSGCIYIDTENLEDVLESEFGDEYGEEIRDSIVFSPDTELIEIGSTYIEYESSRDIAMRQYGEDITERIFSHPDLMILTGNDIIDKHGLKENDKTPKDDVTEYTEKTQIPPKKQYDIEDVLYSMLLLILMGWGTLHIIQEVKNSK